MKHLEPLPQVDSWVEPKHPSFSSISTFKLILMAAVLVAGIGSGLSFLWSTLANDAVSNAQKAELISEFSKLKAIEVEAVAVQDLDEALASMSLAPNRRLWLKGELRAASPDALKLVWITLWDFDAPDGDVIHLSTAGYAMDVPLQKLKNKLAVPVDATNTLEITGRVDGGGGITLGIQNGVGDVSLPVLAVGQTLPIRLAY